MFTGIVSSVGKIINVFDIDQGKRLSIDSAKLDLSDVIIGDSIAHNGVCLTVINIDINTKQYQVDVSPETLNCTCGFKLGDLVNLEKALRYSDRLGGHLVSGHVDGIATISKIENIGDYLALSIKCATDFLPYIAKKGSVAIHGVSLTVNDVQEDGFQLLLIPQTVQATNLGDCKLGSQVNLEIDLFARYMAQMLPALMANQLKTLR